MRASCALPSSTFNQLIAAAEVELTCPHTAPTSPRGQSSTSSASRTPSQQQHACLPPLAPTKLSTAAPHVASHNHSSQPTAAWGASYSFQPLTDTTNADEAEEPHASSSSLPSHLTYTDAKQVVESECEAAEESEAVAPAITYISRLSLDTRTPPLIASATSSQAGTPRNDNKFGLKLALGLADGDSSEAGTPISSLISPQNENKFGLKLNFASKLSLDSPSSDHSPAASPRCSISVFAGASADEQSAAPLPFMNELRDAARDRKHRKGQLSYELTDGGTLLAGGYEINSKGVMRTPNFRPSVSGGQAINLLDGVPALSAAAGGEHRSSTAGAAAGSGGVLTTSIPSTSTSPTNQSPNSSVLLGESLQLCDLVRLSELGAGASGTVVKALHLPTLRLLALKTVSVFSQTDRHQLVKELNGFSTASGPNILQFVGACFAEGSCVMALELMNRGSLEDLVKRYGRVTDEAFLRSMVRQMMLGLSQLARLHCVHRDIKLANLLMDADGRVVLADFGLLRQLDGTQDMCSTFLGTMAFLSPERITGDTYTTKSDVWSTGISIVYLVKGELSMPTEYWSLLSIVNSAAPSLTTADGASELLCDFVRCCLQKDPAERWSADQLLAHPWMTADKLPSKGVGGVWPVGESVSSDAAELDKIVDAVAAHYYRDVPYTASEADLERAKQLAKQLGCGVSIVDEAFRARFATTPSTATTSPSLTSTINYKLPSTLHSRIPSTLPLTMADEAQHDEDSNQHSTNRKVRGLSATLGGALSMSPLIQQRMQQQSESSEDLGYEADSPLNGSAANGISLLASLRDAIATDAVAEEAGGEEEEEQAGSCINYAAAYPSYPC